MRITGGRLAGRTLTSPADRRVRPTAEPVRSALLDWLTPDLAGARVIDLCAGTGALGLEALSRGAKTCDFVEFRPASLHALKANIAALKLQRATRVFKKDAVPFVEALAAGSYDIAFADPPYESRLLDRILAAWRERRFSRVMAVEHALAHAVPKGVFHRAFDDSAITVYR